MTLSVGKDNMEDSKNKIIVEAVYDIETIFLEKLVGGKV